MAKRPKNLKTKIFLDGGDPEETKQVIKMLGFLDGQTTNPTLISKNPQAAKRITDGKKFTEEEIYDFYKNVVQKVSKLIPQGSVSIEVYADENTTSGQMLSQAREFYQWIPNAHIKFPTTTEGLKAAHEALDAGIRVNMTLVFNQNQAAAVYAATTNSGKPSLKGFKNVFLSPFIGRLDDRGEAGVDFIENVVKLYQKGDGHVEVLSASFRNLDHFLEILRLGSDIATVPFKILKEWAEKGMPIPDSKYKYPRNKDLKAIPYKSLDLNKPWDKFDISDPLTEKGIERFSNDWNALID